MPSVIHNSLTALKLVLEDKSEAHFKQVGCHWRTKGGVLVEEYEMKKCLVEIEELFKLLGFDQPERSATKAFFDATVVDVIQKPNTETDTAALRIETFLRQYIEGTTTYNADLPKPFDCFVEELMDIYIKAGDDDDNARWKAIREMTEKIMKLVQRLGEEEADATAKPRFF